MRVLNPTPFNTLAEAADIEIRTAAQRLAYAIEVRTYLITGGVAAGKPWPTPPAGPETMSDCVEYLGFLFDRLTMTAPHPQEGILWPAPDRSGDHR